MEYRTLGNTNLELSTITHGAFAIGGNMWGGNENKTLLILFTHHWIME